MVKRYVLIAGMTVAAMAQDLQPSRPPTLSETFRNALSNSIRNPKFPNMRPRGTTWSDKYLKGPVAVCATIVIIPPPADFQSNMPVVKPGPTDTHMPVMKDMSPCDLRLRE